MMAVGCLERFTEIGALIVSACSSRRAIQNGRQPCPASDVPIRISDAMLRQQG
jgi:hypothetical protein